MNKPVSAIVVDDDKDTVDVFSEWLDVKNVNVVGRAYNGKQAVELFEKHNPDIVFLDLKMPEYDGIYALKKIREKDPHSKIVVVTGNYGSDSFSELLSLKPNAVFQKPFEIEKIMVSVNELMNLKPAQKAA